LQEVKSFSRTRTFFARLQILCEGNLDKSKTFVGELVCTFGLKYEKRTLCAFDKCQVSGGGGEGEGGKRRSVSGGGGELSASVNTGNLTIRNGKKIKINF
jgi:hypothetical protein